ncbi:MAG: dihydrouridine synthase [Verrucomicrobiia bacterium Tous-C3TDCM]|nr:MAG: dihydrouridine synthase [Verrucomicrobiae bacterium Tous-C3TDCM]PAZ06765.1 MAG: dihydrouridine synthase [Verrucomicrobiae bacterium AMD-G2]
MQHVTDLPFMRVLARRGGPDWFVTEFFRVHLNSKPDRYILRSIRENETGIPIFAQIIGSDPESMVSEAKVLLRERIAGIDLNLGCPSPTVCGKSAGGGLLRKPNEIDRMIGMLRDAIPTRFTVKTRVGYHDESEFPALLEVFRKHAIDGLTIHARTVADRYQTPVRPHCIGLARERLSCPVIANGNVVNAQAGENFHRLTGANGLMMGRGAIRNPWLFNQLRRRYDEQATLTPTARDLLEYIEDLYAELARESKDFQEKHHIQRMKKTMLYIVQGLGEEFEQQMRRMQTEEEFFALCRGHLNHNAPLPDVPPEQSKLFCGFQDLLDPSLP